MLFVVFIERFAYPIFLDSVILAELHCDVSPKSHLSGIYICIRAELYDLKVIQFPHPILIILTPVESDLLLWSWVIFLWVWRKPKRKITLTLEKKHETKHNNEIS